MCAAVKNCEQFTKETLFGGFKVAVLVMISNMSVFLCNRFHTRRANSGKITSF